MSLCPKMARESRSSVKKALYKDERDIGMDNRVMVSSGNLKHSFQINAYLDISQDRKEAL